MGKTFYSDYVSHMLKFYCKYPLIESFKSDVDEMNHEICDEVMSELEETERLILAEIFTTKEPLTVIIKKLAGDYSFDEPFVWELLNDVSYDIAVRRGLIHG